MTSTLADAHAVTIDLLDVRVREVVRRDQVDPQVQPDVVRSLAEAVVRDHDQLS